MIVMGIDTSASVGGAALVDTTTLLAEYTLTLHHGHSERIIPTVQQLLVDAELAIDDITAFAVVTGPGSFTGIRVGLATVAGFAYSMHKPLVPLTSMEVLAWQNSSYPFYICPLIDARRHEVFTQLYRAGEPINNPAVVSVAELLSQLQMLDSPVLLVGSGAQVYRRELEQLEYAVFPPLEAMQIRPASVAGLGLYRLQQGTKRQWFEVQPFYMRKSSAEDKFDLAEMNHESGR